MKLLVINVVIACFTQLHQGGLFQHKDVVSPVKKFWSRSFKDNIMVTVCRYLHSKILYTICISILEQTQIPLIKLDVSALQNQNPVHLPITITVINHPPCLKWWLVAKVEKDIDYVYNTKAKSHITVALLWQRNETVTWVNWLILISSDSGKGCFHDTDGV